MLRLRLAAARSLPRPSPSALPPAAPPQQANPRGPTVLALSVLRLLSCWLCLPQRGGSDLRTLFRRFVKVAAPYWSSEDRVQARWRLAAVFALTLGTTGISVAFNFLGRDFYNALSSKDEEAFTRQLMYYLAAFAGGIPVFVMRDYARDTLALRWRAWMTSSYLDQYFRGRKFYNIQSQSLIDNPDQRIVDDLNSFSGTALSFALAMFNAVIDLASFSGILYGIYPPLFGVLVVYSLGGTAISVALGKGLVSLNFMQEKREADFRYGLVRVRENAESIAFYRGERSETALLIQRFRQSFQNYSQLLLAARNLDFFTSGYRYLIQLLPAAVVAPLFFAGKIEFGVINQSFSAFNHVLGDFSLIVYQFQSLSTFSAVIDREFSDILDQPSSLPAEADGKKATSSRPTIALQDLASSEPLVADNISDLSNGSSRSSDSVLLEVEDLTLFTPQYTSDLFRGMSFTVTQGQNLLVMGPSGSGKTSLLRAIAGLWQAGHGSIRRYVRVSREGSGPEGEKACDSGAVGNSVFFVPQRPYMVLGTLRQQVLYPTWSDEDLSSATDNALLSSLPSVGGQLEAFATSISRHCDEEAAVSRTPQPSDNALQEALKEVQLGHLLDRCEGLDARVEWASVLSLGEQQRLALARLLLSKPSLALLDESTSALDEPTEERLYRRVREAGVTLVSVGHRSTLRRFHSVLLELHANGTWSLSLIEQEQAKAQMPLPVRL
eukprot:SM000055S18216  [mRNA]  locus=s55:10621:14377:- [translate_table: standard]